MRLRFRLEKTAQNSAARAGRFQTPHGEVVTPVFMPVGTQATVRSQMIETLQETGSQVLLANTYHLLLRPGPEVFRKFRGIHRFMNWSRPVLTDSGGFQIFSLPHARRMDETGAEFRSYVDGEKILLTPEKSIEMQKAIGSDIMMVLDQCIPSTAAREDAIAAMELTHRWALRSLRAHFSMESSTGETQALFGIVQGACFEDLRRQSAETLTGLRERGLGFDGFAVGGLAVGETKSQREDFCELTASFLPKDLPRYLMGVGTPIDLLEAVHRGIDMFDCILPTALAQQGVAFTSRGKLALRRTVYKFSEDTLDPSCPCETCRSYSRAYLHHLVKTREVLGWHLIGRHNLAFFHLLMRDIRESILADRFAEYYLQTRPVLLSSDDENPPRPQRRAPRENRKDLGDYEIHPNASGTFSIRQKSSGEVMHSVSDPTAEAQALYIAQSRLAAKLSEKFSEGALDDSQTLNIWDVGLGAATNAMAAIRCAQSIHARSRALRIHSFENDLDALRLAVKQRSHFPHLWHGAPEALLQGSRWTSDDDGPKIEWILHSGDFFEWIQSDNSTLGDPDIVFYDPFSYKTNSIFWSLDGLRAVRAVCGKSRPAELFTYSASTAVRAALLGAGFYIARGAGTGPKEETTIALTHPSQERELLGLEWLSRWERSGAKLPLGLAAESAAEFERALRAHPQFHCPI